MSEFQRTHHWLSIICAWFAPFWRQRPDICRSPVSAWFSVLGSRFSVLGSRFSVLGSRFSVLGSRFSVLGSRSSVLGPRFSVLGPQFSVPGSRFSVLVPRILILAFLATTLSGTSTPPAAAAATQTQPFVRPPFAAQMETLRPVILAAAARHNDPVVSGMDDAAFAEMIALVLYNEHFGWLEEAVPPLRPLTPWYQAAQMILNAFGANLTVWPSNIRPSVALEMLHGELPVKGSRKPIVLDLHIEGSRINPTRYRTQAELYAAINSELIQPALAVEYLAANMERGVHRARYEGVPITWQALAAWHNQGIVAPEDIAANPTARDYVRRAAVYRDLARAFIAADPAARHNRAPPSRSLSAFRPPPQSSSYPDRCAPATEC